MSSHAVADVGFSPTERRRAPCARAHRAGCDQPQVAEALRSDRLIRSSFAGRALAMRDVAHPLMSFRTPANSNQRNIVLWLDEMRSIVRASQRSAMNASISISASAMLIVRSTPSGVACD